MLAQCLGPKSCRQFQKQKKIQTPSVAVALAKETLIEIRNQGNLKPKIPNQKLR